MMSAGLETTKQSDGKMSEHGPQVILYPRSLWQREGSEMMKWIQDAQSEADELNCRIGRLSAFFDSESFDKLSDLQRNLLFDQYCAMTKYSTILNLRIRFAWTTELP